MKRFVSMALAVALLLTLWGCGGGNADQSFTVTLPSDVASLDPQTATGDAASMVIGSLFEGLCRVGDDGEARPGVAERWEHNKDFTVFTFHLRKAYWSDGSRVTADDFVFGVTRALDPATGAADLYDLFLIRNARAYHNGEADESALGVRAEDERKLVVELEHGYRDFPLLTAGNRFMPCSREYFAESAGHYCQSAEYTLSNGPFTFPHMYAWDTDYNERSITLARSDTYKGERKATAGTLTYLIDYDDAIDEDPAAAVAGGAVDMMELTGEQAGDAGEAGCEVLTLNDGVTGLLLNADCDTFRYAGTRELFIRALDRADLLERAGNDADEAAGVMPECVLWDGEAYYQGGETEYAAQDEEIAEIIPSLLDLMKWEKIPSVTVLCENDPASIDVANGLLVAWNQQLGNAFNIQPVTESQLKSRVAGGDYEAALYTLRAGGATPFDVLKAFSGAASPTLLSDPGYDAALADLDFTREGFRAMEISLRGLYVFYPLVRESSFYALAPGVSGVAVSPDGRPDFVSARKKD